MQEIEFLLNKRPKTTCFMAFSNQGNLSEDIAKTSKCNISVSKYTKTTLSVCVSTEKCDAEIAYIPKGAEDLKYHHVETYNGFMGITRVCEHLKITKKQRLDAIIKYLTSFFVGLNIGVDELEVTVSFDKEVWEEYNISDGSGRVVYL